MDIGQLFSGIVSNPTAMMLTVCMLALGWSIKTLIETIKENARDHRDTLLKIIPLAEKLTESVEILERLTDASVRGKDK